MRTSGIFALGTLLTVSLTACSPKTQTEAPPAPAPTTHAQADPGHAHDDHGHAHAEAQPSDATRGATQGEEAHGHAHEDHGHAHEEVQPSDATTGVTQGGGAQGHAHDEVGLGAVTLGDMQAEVAQGHGKVAAGQEGLLVVKLPYSGNGATVVRAWIGSKDRTLSYVGKGTYSTSRDVYDIHAAAPSTLPEDTRWWIEVQKPDGTKVLGSIQPLMD